jgi:hypothetical protein
MMRKDFVLLKKLANGVKIINEGNNRGFTFTVGYGFEL